MMAKRVLIKLFFMLYYLIQIYVIPIYSDPFVINIEAIVHIIFIIKFGKSSLKVKVIFKYIINNFTLSNVYITYIIL